MLDTVEQLRQCAKDFSLLLFDTEDLFPADSLALSPF